MYKFRWFAHNVEHVGEHGVEPTEAEFVVNHPARGFPRREADNKYRVWGQAMDGRYLQVVYIFDPPGIVYVIHARPLSNREIRQVRRRSK